MPIEPLNPGVPQALWTAAELAPVLKLSVRTVWTLLGNGTIRSVKIGRTRRVTHAEVLRLTGATAQIPAPENGLGA